MKKKVSDCDVLYKHMFELSVESKLFPGPGLSSSTRLDPQYSPHVVTEGHVSHVNV